MHHGHPSFWDMYSIIDVQFGILLGLVNVFIIVLIVAFVHSEFFGKKIEDSASEIRNEYVLGEITRIEAIKRIRAEFLGTGDKRATLKGAYEYVEQKEEN